MCVCVCVRVCVCVCVIFSYTSLCIVTHLSDRLQDVKKKTALILLCLLKSAQSVMNCHRWDAYLSVCVCIAASKPGYQLPALAFDRHASFPVPFFFLLHASSRCTRA